MTIQKVNSNIQVKTNTVKKGNNEPEDKVILGSTVDTPDFLKIETLAKQKAGKDNESSGLDILALLIFFGIFSAFASIGASR